MKPILAAILLLLAACGGGASLAIPSSGRVVVSLGDSIPGGLAGWYAERDGVGYILLEGESGIVLAHELGHAMGLRHSQDPGCIMCSGCMRPGVDGVWAACAGDVEVAMAAPFPMRVESSIDPAVLDWAMGYWNAALGREQFVR